jgi:hypothetical protein
MMANVRLLLAMVAVVAAAPAVAQQKAEAGAPAPQYERKTVIDFEDDTIQGDLTRPDGEYIDARKKATYGNLIKVRKDFRDEVLESVGEL